MSVPGMRVTGLPVTETPRRVRVASRKHQKDKVAAQWWSLPSPLSEITASWNSLFHPLVCVLGLGLLWFWFLFFAFHERILGGKGRIGKKHRIFYPVLIGSRIPISPLCLPHLWLGLLRSLLSISQRPMQDENFSFFVSSMSTLSWFLSKSPLSLFSNRPSPLSETGKEEKVNADHLRVCSVFT